MNESKYFDVKGEQTHDYFKFYCGECGDKFEFEDEATVYIVRDFYWVLHRSF